MSRHYGNGSVTEDKIRGRWMARVDLGSGPDGRRQRKTVYAPTKAEATKQLRQLLRDRDDDKLSVGREWKTGEWLDWWVDNIVPGTVTGGTEHQYRQVVRTWVKPFVGNVALAKLGPEHVVRMMRALERRGLSPTTQAIARRILRRSLRHAEQFGNVSRNVAAIVDPPKFAGHKLDDSLSPEEAAKVIKAAESDRLGALAVFVLATGARQGEALDLRWSDLDLDAGTATIHGTKSRASVRQVGLPAFAVTALRQHRKRQRDERMAAPLWADPDLVFATTVGTRILGANALRWWQKLCVQAGIGKRRFHATRHTAATLMLNAPNKPASLAVISQTLGHASLAITADIYAKVRPELQRTAADAMEDVLGTAQP
jgi:integrase